MTVEEFSNEFDVLLSTFEGSITLNEYEKSVYLTKAQNDIIIELYTGKNPFNESFEKTEELRRSLNELITQYSTSSKLEENGLTTDSYIFKIPEDVWYITYEVASLSDNTLPCSKALDVTIIPTTLDDFNTIKNNPFRYANERRVLRLDLSNNKVELISKYNIVQYLIRYIKTPTPIILADLPDDLSISGFNTITECKLNSLIHKAILDRALIIALQNKNINTNK